MPKAETSRSADPKRILVVQTAFLGDVVLVTPLLQALRLKYPTAHLALLTTPTGAEILAGFPALNEILSFDKRKRDRGTRATLALGRKLREARFDLALCPHRSARTAVLTALARIPHRIGFADSALPWLYHTAVARDFSRHEVMRNLQLLNPLGGPPPGFQAVLALGSAQNLDLQQLGLSGNGLKVGLCPGSVWPTKRWTAHGYAGLADLLQEQFHAKVYLLGAPQDAAVAAEVAGLCRQPVRNLAGRTTLAELVGVIDRMNLLVTNDSAPVHIASARRVPVVAIFGPTVPAQGFAPFQERAAVVELPLDCRPCGAHGPRTCPLGHFRCMNDLQPRQVLDRLIPLLQGRG
jgi:heptosyltransferase II